MNQAISKKMMIVFAVLMLVAVIIAVVLTGGDRGSTASGTVAPPNNYPPAQVTQSETPAFEPSQTGYNPNTKKYKPSNPDLPVRVFYEPNLLAGYETYSGISEFQVDDMIDANGLKWYRVSFAGQTGYIPQEIPVDDSSCVQNIYNILRMPVFPYWGNVNFYTAPDFKTDVSYSAAVLLTGEMREFYFENYRVTAVGALRFYLTEAGQYDLEHIWIALRAEHPDGKEALKNYWLNAFALGADWDFFLDDKDGYKYQEQEPDEKVIYHLFKDKIYAAGLYFSADTVGGYVQGGKIYLDKEQMRSVWPPDPADTYAFLSRLRFLYNKKQDKGELLNLFRGQRVSNPDWVLVGGGVYRAWEVTDNYLAQFVPSLYVDDIRQCIEQYRPAQ